MSTVPAARLRVRIENDSPIPPFEQLRAQIALQVAAGRLRPGARLPTVRGLARDLDLSPGTVARAYRELEYADIVIGRGRQGTFVTSAPPNAYSTIELRRLLQEAADEFVEAVRQLGIEDAAALEAVQSRLEADRV